MSVHDINPEDLWKLPLWETIEAVLEAYTDSEGNIHSSISNEHLAKQIESQVRAWMKHNFDKGVI